MGVKTKPTWNNQEVNVDRLTSISLDLCALNCGWMTERLQSKRIAQIGGTGKYIVFCFDETSERSRRTKKILHHIAMAPAGCVGWGSIVISGYAVAQIVSCYFPCEIDSLRGSKNRYYHHPCILQTLSGPPPLYGMAEKVGNATQSGRLSFGHLVNKNKASEWMMRGLIHGNKEDSAIYYLQ
ncbi:hypothetical protein Ancab_027541 [Ancistrocladus abbreviatus]